jgi:hypothetical protein
MARHVAHPDSYVTNWNADDRRAPYALARQAAVLDAKPEVDLVSGPVRKLVSDPRTATWESIPMNATPVMLLASPARGLLPRRLSLSDFGRVVGGKFQVVNPPHNAPMFRRRLLHVAALGGFDMGLDPLADWALWVSALRGGSILWHMESPLVLWYQSPRQYSATHAEKRATAVHAVLGSDCAAWAAALGRNVCNLTALRRDAAPV